MQKLIDYLQSIDNENLTGVGLNTAYLDQKKLDIDHLLIDAIISNKLPNFDSSLDDTATDAYQLVYKLFCEDECEYYLEDANLRQLGWNWLERRSIEFLSPHQLLYIDQLWSFMGRKRELPLELFKSELKEHSFIQFLYAYTFPTVIDQMRAKLEEFLFQSYQDRNESDYDVVERFFYFDYLLHSLQQSPSDFADFALLLSKRSMDYFTSGVNETTAPKTVHKRTITFLSQLEFTSNLYGLYIYTHTLTNAYPKELLEQLYQIVLNIGEQQDGEPYANQVFWLIEDQLTLLLRQLILNLWNADDHEEREEEITATRQLLIANLSILFPLLESISAITNYDEKVLNHPWLKEIKEQLVNRQHDSSLQSYLRKLENV